MEYLVLCALGLEKILSNELKKMNYKIKNANDGMVHFSGKDFDYYNLNLNLRTAERVFIKVGEFHAETFDELYDGIMKLSLSHFLPKNGKIIIDKVRSSKSTLYNQSVIQSVLKKAIIEKLKKEYKINSYSEENGIYKIRAYLKRNNVIIALDTTGEGLHKRGYRKLVSEAPLRETIAAAMILKAGWKRKDVLIDPFCGSGTIPIEAALYGLNIAPGLYRRFIFESWKNFDNKKFETLKKQAIESIKYTDLKIFGFDKNYKMIEIALRNAQTFKLDKYIKFEKSNMESIKLNYNNGYIITNPPYGLRIKDKIHAEKIYEQMRYLKKQFPHFDYSIITSHEKFEHFFGQKANKKKKIINGNQILYIYEFKN
ncbi:putative N6-adenine-specific DNA methylase [Marinitoga hydrogenitolerans DSM 16785]|uniref:N6-adenine-specific DNA methylase n=1 Tax=Marinitoga hydrogenitolerans (strain DSM 16785 / JCM 12826 / AT1271) TaxID=1122195 RepID=A0A1M4YST9_MARH1|nr:class I SAM-dependent RNA methyltransferase [Marinitoga hydrogenitolerans]SHF08811.1 putative N6-adenine-specific DNA methylase [Marinitoga hydrogenitolerans DSM 16785]